MCTEDNHDNASETPEEDRTKKAKKAAKEEAFTKMQDRLSSKKPAKQ